MDWLDKQEFYEVCQTYRHARDMWPNVEGAPTAAEAFEALKEYIRKKVGEATSQEDAK